MRRCSFHVTPIAACITWSAISRNVPKCLVVPWHRYTVVLCSPSPGAGRGPITGAEWHHAPPPTLLRRCFPAWRRLSLRRAYPSYALGPSCVCLCGSVSVLVGGGGVVSLPERNTRQTGSIPPPLYFSLLIGCGWYLKRTLKILGWKNTELSSITHTHTHIYLHTDTHKSTHTYTAISRGLNFFLWPKEKCQSMRKKTAYW